MKHLLKIGLILLVLTALTVGFVPVSVYASQNYLSIIVEQELRAVPAVMKLPTSPTRYQGATTVSPTSWGYFYQLENGDTVEVGDSRVPEFKAHVKTIRYDGVAWFSLGWDGGTFTPNLTDQTVSFDFNSNINVSIYPVSPSERLPEGGIEYDVSLQSKPAQTSITLDVDWQGITWRKILPLNIEYDEARCQDIFGVQGAPFARTPTSIVGSDGVTYKTRPEYEVNSYLGTATSPHKDTEIMGWNENTQQPITHTNVSRTYLYIHRGQITDNIGQTAWVEDISMDEVGKTLTFTLPRTWLQKTAVYPIHQVCGVDPAYTQDMDSWQSNGYGGSDSVWGNYDLFTNKSVPKGAVAEIILSNSTTGTENTLGVRADGSTAVYRTVNLHEAEGGGQTHCRMFVVCHATTGLIECYHSDVSDADYFYLVGYWGNVSFTESNASSGLGTTNTWTDFDLGKGASCVHHIIVTNGVADTAETIGVRSNGSSLERKLLLHEPEAGGESAIDFMVKADGTELVEYYTSVISGVNFTLDGYFGTEMDFVELWQDIGDPALASTWGTIDISAYLDQDGRMCDFLMVNQENASINTMGVRYGLDVTTNRYLVEHEAESAAGGNTEYTGFSMSALTSALGLVSVYSSDLTYCFTYLTGYFKPAATGATYDITNSPTSKAFGAVATGSTYWSNGSAPSGNLDDAEALFTITAAGSAAIDVDYHGHNATGGVGCTLTSSSPSTNQYRVKVYKEGDAVPAGGAYLTTGDAEIISNLASSATIDWEISLEIGTPGDGVQKSGIITLTGRAVT